MPFDFRVIQPSDAQELLDYEMRKLVDLIPDENDRAMHAWHVKWRRESLEHYLPMGWSFLARDKEAATPDRPEGHLVGYFIAQPLLFLDGMTQSLWVEHLSSSSLMARDGLCDLAYRLSREKNFQRVFFPNGSGIGNSVAPFKPETWQAPVFCVKTSKA